MVVVVVSALFISLGLWQLSRHDERQLSNAIAQARFESEPTPIEEMIPAAGSDVESLANRRATAAGIFDVEHEVLIRSQTYRGEAGFHVLTPLVLGDGSAVLINRGWVPLVLDQVPVLEALPQDGETSIEGWVHLTQTRGSLGPGDPDEGRLVTMNRVDVGRIQAQTPFDLAPIYLVELNDNFEDLPFAVEVPSFDDNGPHISYAIQWFSFTIIGIIGYWALMRRSLSGSHH